jgi:uncharacterized Zn ribbon protein
MIAHLKCGGVVRTQRADPTVLECQQDGTTWTEKADVWQDAATYRDDVPVDVKLADDVAVVKALPPVRDPKLPRKGTVVEKEVGLGDVVRDEEPAKP